MPDDVSIQETFHTLLLHEAASGTKINLGKCKGDCKGYCTDQLLNFDWYNTYIPQKILGTFFGNVECTHLNIDWQLQSLRNTITAWKHHKLSFKGKAVVINGLLTCTLWHTVTSVNLPPWAITALEAEICNFFCEFGKGLTYAPVEGKLIYFNTNGLETFTTVTEPTLLVGSLFFLLQDFITCFSILLNPIYHQPTIIFLAVTSTALYILSSINQAATPHQDNRHFNYSMASRLNFI